MWSMLDTSMVEWALQVAQSGMTTGILSNICPELTSAFEKECAWLDKIHHKFWSSRLGMAKPSPTIYLHMLDKLALPAEQVLFLDDREENIQAARELGISAIQYADADALATELKNLNLSQHLPPLPVLHALPRRFLDYTPSL